jgi:phenylacetate-CoA ligase
LRDWPFAGEIPTPISTMAGLGCPAIPASNGNIILSLLFQLEQSQWWTPEKLHAQQYRQAAELLRHARDSVPYYRESLNDIGWQSGEPLDDDIWRRVPLLRREDIQDGDGRALISTGYPKAHGATRKVNTSGSSGKPVTVISNAMTSVFWNVITMRDFLWRRVDLNAKVAVIRFDENRLAQYPDGLVLDYWLKSIQPFMATGACAVLDISTPVEPASGMAGAPEGGLSRHLSVQSGGAADFLPRTADSFAHALPGANRFRSAAAPRACALPRGVGLWR